MDELSPLFQDIEFHERFRGYDPDEVDAYVDRIARAAAAAQGRMRTLQERLDAAEDRLASGGATTEAEETLTRTLVLAQRTADTAVAEARDEAERLRADAESEADATLSGARAEAQVTLREAQAEATAVLDDATERATALRAEAEAERRALVDNAEAVAAEAASAERERLAAELQELQEFRAFLTDDIEILERHLSEQRHQLAVSLSTLTDLLDSPEIFRRAAAPATSGVTFDADLLDVAEVDVAEVAVADEVPVAYESPVADEVAVADEVPVANEVPVADEVAVGDEVPVADDVVASPAPRWVSAAEQAVAEEFGAEPPTETATPADEVAPVLDLDEVADEEPVSDPGEAAEAVPVLDLDGFEEADVVDEVAEEEPVSDREVAEAVPVLDLDGFEEADVVDEVAEEDRVEAPLDLEEISAGADEEDYIDLDAPGEAAMATVGDGVYAEMADTPAEGGGYGEMRDAFGPPRLVTAADLDHGPVGGEPGGDVDPGLPTAPVPTIDDQSLFAEPREDSFLAQLRQAVASDDHAPDDDEALAAFFDQEEDDGTRSWFGRRR